MNADASSTAKQTAAVAEQGATTAPEKASTRKEATAKSKAGKANRSAKKAAPKVTSKASKPAKKNAKSTKAASKVSAAGRANSKKMTVLDLLRRKDGATMGEIAKATRWQHHSIRGFISGTISKKMGLAVESAKNESGERTYRIAK